MTRSAFALQQLLLQSINVHGAVWIRFYVHPIAAFVHHATLVYDKAAFDVHPLLSRKSVTLFLCLLHC